MGCSLNRQKKSSEKSYPSSQLSKTISYSSTKSYSSSAPIKTPSPSQTIGPRFHHKVLVVGKTGAGKSTAINMFVNLINQKQYKDPRKIAISQKINISDEDIILNCNMPEFYQKQSDALSSQTSDSQTSKAFVYEIRGNDYDMSLIDTPGLGDTKGTQTDEQNTRTIVAGIQKLSQITCILYIHRISDCRDVLYLKYYLNQLKDLLPMEYKGNFVIGFTSATSTFKIDAISVLKKAGIPVDKYVCFENDCFIHPDLIPNLSDSSTYKSTSQIYWQSNTQQFQKFIEMIKPMKSQDTSIFLDLFCKKQAFVKMIYQKQHKIDETQQIKALNNQIIANIVDVKQTLERSINQPSVKPIWKTMKKKKCIKKYLIVKLKEKVTYCYNCCNVCHDPCFLEEIYNKGDVKIRQCTAFGCGTLYECNKCSHAPEYHGHTMEIQQIKDEEQEFDYEYVEKQSPQGTSQTTINNEIGQAINKLTSKEDILKKQLKETEEEIEKATVFIAALVKLIKDQSMNFNNQIIIEYIEEQIQNTKEDQKLDYDERKYKLNEHNEQLIQYQKLENEIKNAQNFNFAKYNQPQLEREIKQLLDEEAEIIKSRDFS